MDTQKIKESDGFRMKEYIDKKDAINVEVVHGKWETEIDDELGILKHTCQNCGFVKRTDIHVALDWNFCPNCGAKMDLEE